MSAASARIQEWKAKPGLFVRQVLRATPDSWQDEVLEEVVARQRIALKASKGPGKSTLLAWIGWWFLLTRSHPKVVATSISGDNLRDGLWAELAKWQQHSELLKHAFTWTRERIVANDHPQTWWAAARQWSQDADATKQADTLAGIHADRVLFLIDEAGGIPDAVVGTAEAGLANADEGAGREAKLIIAGNPTQLSGPLYRACTRERRLWWVKEISGDPDDPRRAPRVSITWAREQIEKYGRENPWVLVNVFGKFPPGQSNALLGVEDATAASTRVLMQSEYIDETRILGVDVARFGDDRSVIFPRQGRAAMRPEVFRNLDTMQLASQVALVMGKWQPHAVFIDVDGVGGGVVDRLRQLGHPVVGVHFGGAAAIAAKFANKRSEMWWEMCEWVKAGGCTPDDAELVGELTAPTYEFNARGAVQLEPKADIKKRGLPSPDKADALALTFAAPVAHPEVRRRQDLEAQSRRMANDFDPYAEAR